MLYFTPIQSPWPLLVGALISLATPAGSAAEEHQWTESDRLSYALGMDLGLQMRRHGINLNPSVFASGLVAGLAEDDSLMTPWDVKAVIGLLQQELKRRQAEALAQAAAAKGQDGESGSARPEGPADASSPATPPAVTSPEAPATAAKPAN